MSTTTISSIDQLHCLSSVKLYMGLFVERVVSARSDFFGSTQCVFYWIALNPRLTELDTQPTLHVSRPNRANRFQAANDPSFTAQRVFFGVAGIGQVRSGRVEGTRSEKRRLCFTLLPDRNGLSPHFSFATTRLFRQRSLSPQWNTNRTT